MNPVWSGMDISLHFESCTEQASGGREVQRRTVRGRDAEPEPPGMGLRRVRSCTSRAAEA